MFARLRRGHGWRKINEPLGIDRETAHHFQCGDSVLFADGDARNEPSIDDSFADNIFQIEGVIERVLCCTLRLLIFGQERSLGLVVGLVGAHRNHVALWVAEC